VKGKTRTTRGAESAAVAAAAAGPWEGFFLPAALRARLVTTKTPHEEVSYLHGGRCGVDCEAAAPGSVTVRWPLLTAAEWAEIVQELREAREKAPRGPEYWLRLQAALSAAARRLSDRADPTSQALLDALSSYTGYSRGMVASGLAAPDLWDLDRLPAALRYHPNKACGARWTTMADLPGRIRFFPTKSMDKAAGWVPVAWEMPLFGGDVRPGMVLGHSDRDIPGTALAMTILALSATLRGEAPLPRPVPPPVVVMGSSVREPMLAPWVLSAIERQDPEIVSMVAVLPWDPADERLRHQLLAEADLVVAAAGDDVISSLGKEIRSLPHRPPFHAHAPKVSFTAISREVLEVHSVMDSHGWTAPGGTEIMGVVALLAGLDSAFWDQNGCLGSRVHFVEKRGVADGLPTEYARRLTKRLRQIHQVMPRGAWPVRRLHDPFDRCKAIEGSDRWGTGLTVVSDYDDPFLVVLDDRAGQDARPDPSVFRSLLAECQTRVVLVRPVDDLMEVPWYYLPMLPRHSLQSLSVALGRPGSGLTREVLDLATACGLRGVTSIRIVGRGAIQQLPYSWDGLLPLDLVGRRAPGHFTTMEFDSPFEDMMAAYRTHLARLAAIPAVDQGGAVRTV